MSVAIQLSEELAAEIDRLGQDRTAFVAQAVRKHLRQRSAEGVRLETDRINRHADELNQEAADVLEYQVRR